MVIAKRFCYERFSVPNFKQRNINNCILTYFTKIIQVLLLAMLSLIFINETYTKYTTELTGSSNDTIAKWDWTINNNSVSKDDTEFTFDLFKTIKDTDGGTEADVTTQKIAPGTKGLFEITVSNLSEVNTNYSLTLTETKGSVVSNANIEYSIIGTDEATDWTDDIETFNLTDTSLNMNASKTVTLYWRWAYSTTESQDTADTAVGFAVAGATSESDKSITVKAILNFTQID